MEYDMVTNNLRGALNICVCHRITHVVVGDFGLGSHDLNPLQELAEL